MKSTVVDMKTRRALAAVAALSELEQRVVIWRFGLFGQPELSVRQVACRLNMRPGAVREIERRALRTITGGRPSWGEVA